MAVLVAAFAGLMQHRRRQPPPPGMATVRAAQAAQGDVRWAGWRGSPAGCAGEALGRCVFGAGSGASVRARTTNAFTRAPPCCHRGTPGAPPDDDSRTSRVANIKSQIKRNKTNEKARLRNKAVKSSLKTAIRKYRTAVEAGDVARPRAGEDASRALDKAASKGVIHANQAANRKSSIMKTAAA